MKNIDLFGNEIIEDVLLRDKFIEPPFSVLDTRRGEWQARKKAWINLGIKSELGRGEGLSLNGKEINADNLNFYRDKNSGKSQRGLLGFSNTVNNAVAKKDNKFKSNMKGADEFLERKGKYSADKYNEHLSDKSKKALGCYMSMGGGGTVKRSNGRQKAEAFGTKDWFEEKGLTGAETGTSIFDPALAEVLYHWFAPKGGDILDPFAGGSVRGIVANYLGYKYTGLELRAEQVESNIIQAKNILKEDNQPEWVVGDSDQTLDMLKTEFDFILSCPPYFDLEIYSDLSSDLSNMAYQDFLTAYYSIINKSCKLLKQDSFACFVVSEIRDAKTGIYRNFVGETIQAFQKAGLLFYNDAVLINVAGSLPIRAGKQFISSKKLGRMHQNIVIFYKGNPKNIKEKFNEII
jgi:DNA modification methylase